jgi:mannose-6-phosphate isomerase-like protein (cupin superfamily)
MADMQEVVGAWQTYLGTVDDWEALVRGVEPKEGGCGLVYELPNPIERPDESFAIADMRQLDISEPHKHINGETEIYFVMQGAGRIAVGTEMRSLAKGDYVVTPPDTIHCTLPDDELILAVVNTPPFNIDNYVAVSEEDQPVAKMLVELRADS